VLSLIKKDLKYPYNITLKEFLKPNWKKIVLTILLLLLTGFMANNLYLGLEKMPTPVVIVLGVMLLIFSLLLLLLLDFGGLGFIIGLISLIIEILWLYIISCILMKIIIFLKNKLLQIRWNAKKGGWSRQCIHSFMRKVKGSLINYSGLKPERLLIGKLTNKIGFFVVLLILIQTAVFFLGIFMGIPGEDFVDPHDYCTGLDYNLEYNQTGGFCVFPDGSKCNDWSFFRGECGQQFTFCEQNGFTLEYRTDNVYTYAVCIFDDGSECKEIDYFANKCKPSKCSEWILSKGGCVPAISSGEKIVGFELFLAITMLLLSITIRRNRRK